MLTVSNTDNKLWVGPLLQGNFPFPELKFRLVISQLLWWKPFLVSHRHFCSVAKRQGMTYYIGTSNKMSNQPLLSDPLFFFLVRVSGHETQRQVEKDISTHQQSLWAVNCGLKRIWLGSSRGIAGRHDGFQRNWSVVVGREEGARSTAKWSQNSVTW